MVVDPTRNVAVWAWSLSGEAFGNDKPNEDPDGDGKAFVLDMRFPGQRYDVISGFNLNYFRDFDALTGRYVQSDPVGLAGGISTYSYVEANPLAFDDPTGLSKGGKKNLNTEGFTKKSSPLEVERALKEAIELGQKERAASLRELLKVIKRGGTIAEGFLPTWVMENVLKERCVNGDQGACVVYCKLNPEECSEAAKSCPAII